MNLYICTMELARCENLIISHSLQIWRRLERFSRTKQVSAQAVRAAKCLLIKARRESSSTLADMNAATRACSKTNHAQSAQIRSDINVRKRSVKHRPVSWDRARNSSVWKLVRSIFSGFCTLLRLYIINDYLCYHKLQTTKIISFRVHRNLFAANFHFTTLNCSPRSNLTRADFKCQIKCLFCETARERNAFQNGKRSCAHVDKSRNLLFSLLHAEFQRGSHKASFLSDYDTGIGSSTTLGSPQPICRSQVKTNGCFTNYMQVSWISNH